MIRAVIMCCLLLLSCAARAELSYELLDKLTDAPAQLMGNFQQDKHLQEYDVSIVSKGQFEYKRDAYIRWITTEPVANELMMTPDEMVSRQGDEEMLHLSADKNPTVKLMSQIFFAVLTAQWHDLSEYFFANGEQSGNNWTVILTPRTALIEQHVTSITLEGDRFLRSILLSEPNGDSTHIRFSNLQQ